MPNGLEQENRNANAKVVPLQLDGAVIMSTNTKRKPGLADTAIADMSASHYQVYHKFISNLTHL